jgi:septum site-determining protein MinC
MSAAAPQLEERGSQGPGAAAPEGPAPPAAVLKGGPRGLELLVAPGATTPAIAAALGARLEEAPGFFRGAELRVRVDGPLPAGLLARLDELASRFELRIAEIGPRKPRSAEPSAPVAQLALAAGSAPAVATPAGADSAPSAALAPGAALAPSAALPPPAPVDDPDRPPEPPEISILDGSVPVRAGIADAARLAPALPRGSAALEDRAGAPRTRMVVGPVRSGVILDHAGHVVVIGDVNPGAEVRAAGNILVLGRLRGVAHAGIGGEAGFIFALRLEPQQLRIGRLVARASDHDAAGGGAELAHATAQSIIVERYTGRLPAGLAAGISGISGT